MIVFLLALLALCLYKIKFNIKGFNKDYMNKEQTTALKGVFALIIFLSHVRGYIALDGVTDNLYSKIIVLIGQCMVGVFFLYSGYGVLYGYVNKPNYDKGFLRKRLFVTWFHFAVAIVMYIILNVVLNINYSIKDYALAFTGWSSIGNSNWFMFDTFMLYFLIWISFKINNKLSLKNKENKNNCVSISLIFIMISCLFVIMISKLKESWWYDTVFCFGFGCLYYCFKSKIDEFLFSSNSNYLIALVTSLFLYIAFKKNATQVTYNIVAILFVLIITLITVKVKIVNKIILWLGTRSFYIYIYMRIPMIIFKEFGIFSNNEYLFTICTFLITIALSGAMNLIHKKTDKILLK